MDIEEVWKPMLSTKKDLLSGGFSLSPSPSLKHLLPRSFSTKSSSSSSLSRSSSQKSSVSPKRSLTRSLSQKTSNISRRCSILAKEQKARFYIMKRCVGMLVCWHKHGDSY